ncbi:efflux transporter outer membrane subunit [Gemmatimonas groenlandica]|uniref:Efflux transporter outer membrane subunit n=1 Tax=Gemmatimonas groenlandica TaxID=2732249 RepID=A0A6M4IPI5_9BACT|nr:efflux transporter outer membrane subunit [Gemmatimonas groenlandica]QJR36653.1 efflux transporter outer membrane subunit [Gemmatimonas groenlandica]
MLPGPVATARDSSAAWWRGFGLPALDTLIDVALQNSPDIHLSIARLAEARATMRGTNANWDPGLSPTASYTRSEQVIGNFGAISTTVASVSTTASWELDLFGRLRQERAAGVADGIAAAYDAVDVRRTTVAQIARVYFDVLSTSHEATVLDAQRMTRRTARSLEASRARVGLNAGRDSIRADGDERDVLVQLTTVRARRAELLGDLAALTGSSMAWVDSVVRLTARMEVRVQVPEEGIPAEWLRLRPDVRAAESRVVAATARVEVASRALRPSLSLVGSTGRNRTNESSWVPTWSFGPSLAINLPTRAGRAQVSVRRSQLTQREIEWRQAVREAASDVDVAFARVRQYQARVERQRESVSAYRTLVSLSRSRFTSGLVDYRAVLDDQRALLEAERTHVEYWTAYAKSVVTMFQATGAPAAR